MPNILKEGINNYIKILNNIENCIKNSEKEPRLLLSELMKSSKVNSIIINTINAIYGEEGLIEFQEDIMGRIIEYLNKNFNLEVKYSFNKEVFPSPIEIRIDNGEDICIALLDIYDRNLIILENEKEQELLNEIDKISEKVQILESDIKKIQNNMENLLASTGKNPIKIANVLINKDKIKNNMIKECQILSDEIILNEKNISIKKVELNKIKQDFLYIKEIQNKLMQRLKKAFNYEIVNENNTLNEENDFIPL